MTGRTVTVGRGNPRLPASIRRRIVHDSLVASGDAPRLQTNFMLDGSLASRRFYELVLESGYEELAHDQWPCELATLGDVPSVVFRDGEDVVTVLPGGAVAKVRLAFGWLEVRVAAPDRDLAAATCTTFRQAYPASYLTQEGDELTPITFWTLGQYGPVPRLRKIETAEWADVERNYPAAVRAELDDLMAWTEPARDGQLFVWQGPPGTGKSWALRALASAWAPWAEFHYITDPDAFFVKDPSYMINVLLSDSYSAIDAADGNVYEQEDPLGKWRVLILEDTGELLAANAKEAYGQGLSRLLNVVDGMIGQGLRVLALVTTNDELGDLAPAAVRPGRCASRTSAGDAGPTVFGAMSAEEASEWLGQTVEEGGTLAELYALRAQPKPAFKTDDEPEESATASVRPEPPRPDPPLASAAFGRLLELASRPLDAPRRARPAAATLEAQVPAPPADHGLIEKAFDAIASIGGHQAPPPVFHFHLPDHALDVSVHTPAVDVPVTVNTPPVSVPVTVEPAAATVEVHNHAAEQAPPTVEVHVPEQPPAPVEMHTHVQPAPVEVTVMPQKPHAIRVERASDGSTVYVPEEVE